MCASRKTEAHRIFIFINVCLLAFTIYDLLESNLHLNNNNNGQDGETLLTD